MPPDVPDSTPQIIPYLYYEDAAPALEFMEKAFGFEIVHAFRNPTDDKVLHAQVSTGTGKIFVGPGMDAFGTRGVADPEWVSSMTYVYVNDVDAHYARATAAGAVVTAERHVHPGDNYQYTVRDPGGQRWTFAQPAGAEHR